MSADKSINREPYDRDEWRAEINAEAEAWEAPKFTITEMLATLQHYVERVETSYHYDMLELAVTEYADLLGALEELNEEECDTAEAEMDEILPVWWVFWLQTVEEVENPAFWRSLRLDS